VHNTPWGERHGYVLDAKNAECGEHGAMRFRVAKAFHVSPFMDMNLRYVFHVGRPDESLFVHIRNDREGDRLFDATLTLRRREIHGRSLASALLAHPFQTARVALAIYWEATRLFLKGAPFHPHPEQRS
jgi:DUF1365 family protein